MRQGEFTQDGAARWRQPNPDLAFILIGGTPLDGAGLLQPVYQLYGAVVVNEQSRGNLSNRRFDVFRQAMHRKQQLMLLRLNAVFFRGHFAEMKKPPDLPPELG
jgi:hypothetical protein